MVKKRKKRRTKKKAKVINKKSVIQNTFKSGEIKVPIKKIKKQPNEKRIYSIKDYVVYPKHGVGKISGIEKANGTRLLPEAAKTDP